jgi:hypothetical protein
LLHRRSRQGGSRFAGPIVVTILVWCQLDDRAWIGAVALLAGALGHEWDLRRSPPESAPREGSLLSTAVASLLIMLLHPFLWETWLSAVRLYQYEYPAQQTYAIRDASDYFRHFPLWSADFWTLNYFNAAALLLWVVTLVVLVLNAARVRMSHLALFVTMSLIAAAGGTELAVASITMAALATLNAQQWYAAGFRQTYSTETGELVFSRGGRALTVLALFGLGFMMVAGHLTGAGGRRVGAGFSRDLQQSIDSYASVLADSFDDRPFSFRPTQGDVLIWVGKRPFVDSRLRLFAAGSPSIIDEHLQARAALRIPLDGSLPQRHAWQSILDKYEITQALPRLSGAAPDYITLYDLLNNPDWVMIELDADTATFCRTDLSDPALAAYVAQHRKSDLVQNQFRVDETDVVSDMRSVWPSSPSVYTQYFYQPPRGTSRPLQRARHYLALSEGVASADQAVAALYAAIRDVHRGLVEHPSDHTAYLVLARAYATLWSFERGLMEAQQLSYPGALRYLQTLSAYHQAIVSDPTDPVPHLRLFGLYTQQQRHDLAERQLQQFERIAGRLTTLTESDPRYAAEQEQMQQHLAQLTMQVNERRAQRDDDLAAGMDPAALAGTLAQSGYPLMALEVIEADLTQLSGNPELAYLYARLLLESGRTREAYDQLQGLKALADTGQLPDWALYLAISNLAAEDHYAALEVLRSDQLAMSTSAAMAMLYQHPLQAAARTDLAQPIDPMIPVARRLQLASIYFDQLLPRIEANAFNQALIRLELGMNAEAADLLEKLLQHNPLSPLRPVVETYLQLLREMPDIPPAPNVESLTTPLPDLFAEEKEQAPDGDEGPPPDSGAPPDGAQSLPPNPTENPPADKPTEPKAVNSDSSLDPLPGKTQPDEASTETESSEGQGSQPAVVDPPLADDTAPRQ